jgi:hypothetical protein
MFDATQRAFAGALLDAEMPVPESVTSSHTAAREKRFAVYRNNVVVGLIDALASRFPATLRIVGEEFFRAMARLYVAGYPPRTRLMMYYGDDFPEFIAGFIPAAEMPYLADVARLEAARTLAYHAADAMPLDPGYLRSVGPSALENLRIQPHPSAQIVRSEHPVVTIWAMNAGERELGEIAQWHAEDALIVRPELEVFVRSLPPGGATFLGDLFAGETLLNAAGRAQQAAGDFDLASNLAGLISSGVAVEVLTSESRR